MQRRGLTPGATRGIWSRQGLAQLEAVAEARVWRLRRACSRQSEHYAHSQAKNGDDLPPARQQEYAGNWTDDLQHRSHLWLGVRSNLLKTATHSRVGDSERSEDTPAA
jgi:hypothetical protein